MQNPHGTPGGQISPNIAAFPDSRYPEPKNVRAPRLPSSLRTCSEDKSLTHPIFEIPPRRNTRMSIRTGDRSRHNRRKKQYARNRIRIRLFRAELAAAAAAAAAAKVEPPPPAAAAASK
jgi:hypothetical protein